MFNRIARIVLLGVISFYSVPIHASPIGLYIKPLNGIYYWGEKSVGKENFAFIPSVVWQPNRTHMLEIGAKVLQSTKNTLYGGSYLTFSLFFADKHVIPLKYYLNIYTQWGFSVKTKLGVHEPFVGMGLAYYHNRYFHGDISWRCHKPFSQSGGRPTQDKYHSVTFGLGYYVR
jgi:hypothetical protein